MSECPTCGAAVHVYRDEARDLRARLVEVEAESKLKYADLGVEVEELGEQNRQLRARLAAVEAERDALQGEVAEYRKRRDADLVTIHELNTQLVSHDCLTELADAEVRAAACGEGDRPAEPGIWPGGGIAFSELRPAAGTDDGEGDR